MRIDARPRTRGTGWEPTAQAPSTPCPRPTAGPAPGRDVPTRTWCAADVRVATRRDLTRTVTLQPLASVAAKRPRRLVHEAGVLIRSAPRRKKTNGSSGAGACFATEETAAGACGGGAAGARTGDGGAAGGGAGDSGGTSPGSVPSSASVEPSSDVALSSAR